MLVVYISVIGRLKSPPLSFLDSLDRVTAPRYIPTDGKRNESLLMESLYNRWP